MKTRDRARSCGNRRSMPDATNMRRTMPPMRRWCQVGVLLLLAACTTDGGNRTTEPPQTTTAGPTTTTERPSTGQLMEDLDASLCPDSVFTCVTLDMPMNHFDPADERTIPVTFAVLPATGDSLGAFVTATGGPGSSGHRGRRFLYRCPGPGDTGVVRHRLLRPARGRDVGWPELPAGGGGLLPGGRDDGSRLRSGSADCGRIHLLGGLCLRDGQSGDSPLPGHRPGSRGSRGVPRDLWV